MKTTLLASLIALSAAHAQPKWIEAESFASHGGWVLDTQFIDVMDRPT
jgi:hypothetical protein